MSATELNRYQYISLLANGGMASVSLAEDAVLGRKVALKRLVGTGIGSLSGFSARDEQAVSRLRREAVLGASLSHPNLVSIYDVIDAPDGDVVIVMEYVQGETLGDRIKRRGALAPAETLEILEGIAAGLDAIHDQGIVHRDVKPANVLLGDDGAVKLADLGIAVISGRTRITSVGEVVGSYRYMAPEQLEDAESTPATDVYALGAVAFEALSGELARSESHPMALAHAIATQPPPELNRVWPDAPPAAAAVLMRAMAREPERRPRRAGELVARLRRALEPVLQASEDALPPAAVPLPLTVPLVPRRPSARSAGASEQPSPGAVAGAGAAAASGVPAASGRPAASGAPGASGSPPRRGRRIGAGLIALAALLLAVGVAGALVATNSSSSSKARSAGATAAAGARTHTAPARAGSSTSATPTSGTTAAGRAAGGAGAATAAGSSKPASSGSAAGAAPAAAGSSASRAPAAGSAGAAASSGAGPVNAVESFYHLAAAHRYSEAWSLADPTFQSQLGGYSSFQGGQAADRSITFNSANVTSSSPTAATVAVQTTSVRQNGTQQCSGTVDTVRSGAGGPWMLHMIHINCA